MQYSLNTATDVKMVNANVGYAIINGDVYKTQDGGATWEVSLAADGITAYGMSFPDENNGFLIGGFQEAWLMRTADGGSTWDSLDPPTGFINSPMSYSIDFLSAEIGYVGAVSGAAVADGRLFVTEDGGDTWAEREAVLNFRFASIAFSISSPSFGVAADTSGRLMITSDAGLSWEEKELELLAVIRDVAVVGSDKVYAVGDSGGRAYLAVSEDGGASWTEWEIEGTSLAYDVDVIP